MAQKDMQLATKMTMTMMSKVVKTILEYERASHGFRMAERFWKSPAHLKWYDTASFTLLLRMVDTDRDRAVEWVCCLSLPLFSSFGLIILYHIQASMY